MAPEEEIPIGAHVEWSFDDDYFAYLPAHREDFWIGRQVRVHGSGIVTVDVGDDWPIVSDRIKPVILLQLKDKWSDLQPVWTATGLYVNPNWTNPHRRAAQIDWW